MMDKREIYNYCSVLTAKFYKILPLTENAVSSRKVYLDGLIRELIGADKFMVGIMHDGRFLSLIAILFGIRDLEDELSHKEIKRDVFGAIGIIKKIQKEYGEEITRGGV